MFTLDASVHINALNPAEEGSQESRALLEQVFRRPWPVYSPTLLLVELAGSVARVLNDADRGIEVALSVRNLPGQIWIPLDTTLAEEAARVAAEHRLRGADAIYAAVARRHGATVVTRDREQLDRLPPTVSTVAPEEALLRLNETHSDG